MHFDVIQKLLDSNLKEVNQYNLNILIVFLLVENNIFHFVKIYIHLKELQDSYNHALLFLLIFDLYHLLLFLHNLFPLLNNLILYKEFHHIHLKKFLIALFIPLSLHY